MTIAACNGIAYWMPVCVSLVRDLTQAELLPRHRIQRLVVTGDARQVSGVVSRGYLIKLLTMK